MWDPNPLPFNVVLQELHLNARNKVNLSVTHPDHKVYEESVQRDLPSYVAHLTYQVVEYVSSDACLVQERIWSI